MSYSRFFMPLGCEAGGYEFKGRAPAGRSIVEERGTFGKISLWVQDLKPEVRYSIYMIFADGARFAGVLMGMLAVDTKGRGEFRKDVDSDELNGFDLDSIVAVAVVAADSSSVVSPLCGYREQPVTWRHGFYVSVKSAEAEVVVESKVETVAVEPSVEEPPLDIVPAQESPEDIAVDEACEQDNASVVESPAEAEPSVEAEPTAEPVEDFAPEETCCESSPPTPEVEPVESSVAIPAPAPVDESPPPPSPEIQHEAEASPVSRKPPRASKPKSPASQRSITTEFRQSVSEITTDLTERIGDVDSINAMELILNGNPSAEPFTSLNREARWVEFSINDSVPMPRNRPNLLEEPFVRAAYANHGHLLLGETTDTGPKKYIIGLPSVYQPEQRQQARRLGFSQFKCNKGERAKRGELGYWLMFVNL